MMKNSKINSGLMSNTKNNKKNYKKINTLSNQALNLDLYRPQTKTKKNPFSHILMKFKTQKSSPHKNPAKSLNKIIDNKNNNNQNFFNKSISKSKLLNQERNSIISYTINNKRNLNLNIKMDFIKSIKNKKNKVFHKNVDNEKNNKFRNTNIISNYRSNTNTNINTINNVKYYKNNDNNNSINNNNMTNNSSNIQYIYKKNNSKTKQILLPIKKSIKQQRTLFHKNFKYNLNMNMTTPITLNNSRKTSTEKKIQKNNALVIPFNKNKKNYKNHNIDNNYNKDINKINHTTLNSPHRSQIVGISGKRQIKLKNDKDNKIYNKVYLRTGQNQINSNINNYNLKISHITSINSKNNANNIINSNNSSFFFIPKNKNKNNKKIIKSNNNNSTFKTISHKQSFNNIINDKDINNKIDFICNKNNLRKQLNIKNENNLPKNKSTKNYYQLDNNYTSTNLIFNNKKNPKILDVKKCIIGNKNTNKTIKNNIHTDINNNNNNNTKTLSVRSGRIINIKEKQYIIVNNKPNIKINELNNNIKKNNSKREFSKKKMIKNNTLLNYHNKNHKNNCFDYDDITDNINVIDENDKKKLIRNYSNNNAQNKVINSRITSIIKPKLKSLSKLKNNKTTSKLRINGIHSLLDDIKKVKNKKKNKYITANLTTNSSHKNTFIETKNILNKKIKTLTDTVSNSNNNTTLKRNNRINNNIIKNINKHNINSSHSIALFYSEYDKETKNILINQGKYFIKESECLSKYIKDYYLINDNYPKSQVSFYKYGRLIGKGAFGKVNLGLHVLTGRIVAIKSFNLKKLKNEGAKAKIYHEINLMKNLRHSSIVKLLDTFETPKYILIVMENISGGDLLSFVKKRTKISEKISKFIFRQILQAIKYIHSKNIVHRDIKLDNVLIDLNNNIKICDFGVGKIIHEGEILTDQCGTPAYIAPEILENKGYEGPPVDLWSSGVVLYSMLSGTVPFKSNNVKDLQHNIMSGNFSEIPDISKECNDLLHKLLQVNPKKRINIDEALEHPWFNINSNNILEENKLSIFTKAEMVLLSKNYLDYRYCAKDEIIENFTLNNLDTINISENKNNLTKSFIFAPFNSSYLKEEIKENNLEENLSVENNIILFDEKLIILNRQYELNNNGEIDHGVLINRSNMSSKNNIITKTLKSNSNNTNNNKDEEKQNNNGGIQQNQNIQDKKFKKILTCSNSKKVLVT